MSLSDLRQPKIPTCGDGVAVPVVGGVATGGFIPRRDYLVLSNGGSDCGFGEGFEEGFVADSIFTLGRD